MSNGYPGLHVMVVDDSEHTRSLVKEVLISLGFQRQNIREAGDGVEALKGLRASPLKFVICGWRMEPMDGLTFVRKLRNAKESPKPGLPVIFCSRYVDKTLVEQAREAGINEILVKPLNVAGFERAIRSVLERPRAIIKLHDYVGPDRRRLDLGGLANERRTTRR